MSSAIYFQSSVHSYFLLFDTHAANLFSNGLMLLKALSSTYSADFTRENHYYNCDENIHKYMHTKPRHANKNIEEYIVVGMAR